MLEQRVFHNIRLLCFDDNKVLKIINWICWTFVQVYRIMIKDIFIEILIEQVKSKEIHLKLKSIWKNASEEQLLKKRVWRRAPEDTSSETRTSEAKVVRSYDHQKHISSEAPFIRVDKGQCTKCRTTNSALVSATTFSVTCLQIKTRITTILQQTLFLWKQNGFEISSS